MDVKKEVIKKEHDEIEFPKEIEANEGTTIVETTDAAIEKFEQNECTESPKKNGIVVKQFPTTSLDKQPINKTEICRLCASNSSENMYCIFEPHEVSLYEKINFCLPVTISAEDELPNNICDTCKDSLEEFYRFANKVAMADEILKSRFGKEKEQPIEVPQKLSIKSNDQKPSTSKIKENKKPIRGHYECHLCGKKFRYEHLLKEHSETHKDLTSCVLKVCSFCGEAFNTDELASSHLLVHVGKNVHMEHTLVDMAYRCEFCEKLFVNCNKLMYHKNCEHQIKIFSCGICMVKFTTENRREEHKQIHIGLKGMQLEPELPIVIHYVCEQCGKTYLQFEYLHAHQKLKHREPTRTYKCQKCKEVFPNGSAIAYHYKQKHNISYFLCPEKKCHQQFLTEALLKKHLVDVHKPPEVCHKCGKIFLDKPALRQHIQNNHTLSVHICEICGLSFQTGQAFHLHKQDHVEGRKEGGEFECTFCKKQYSQRHELQKHMRSAHSGSFRLLVDMEEDSLEQEQNKNEKLHENDHVEKGQIIQQSTFNPFLNDPSIDQIFSSSFIDADQVNNIAQTPQEKLVYLNNFSSIGNRGDSLSCSNDEPSTSKVFDFPDFANNVDENGQLQYYFVNVEGNRKVLLLDNS